MAMPENMRRDPTTGQLLGSFDGDAIEESILDAARAGHPAAARMVGEAAKLQELLKRHTVPAERPKVEPADAQQQSLPAPK